jgi:hypothetical protein
MWNLTSFFLETVLLSRQDRCTICAKRTIGSEIILVVPGDVAQAKAHFILLGDSANLDAR